MSKFATLDREEILSAKLRVVGVGGGGCNAIESMNKKGLVGVEYVAINTDSQVLDNSSAKYKIQIGTNVTRGLGAGADPNVGRTAAEEDRDQISRVLEGSDMVFQNLEKASRRQTRNPIPCQRRWGVRSISPPAMKSALSQWVSLA